MLLHTVRTIIEIGSFRPKSLMTCLFCFIRFYQVPAQPNRVDSLLNRLSNAKEDTTKAIILNDISREYLFYLNDKDKGNEFNKKLLALSTQGNYKKGIAHGFFNSGVIHEKRGNNDSAAYCYSQSLSQFREIKWIRGEMNAVKNLGVLYAKQNDLQKAYGLLSLSLKIAESIHDTSEIAQGTMHMGSLCLLQGNYTKALEYYYKALKINEGLGDKGKIAKIYHHIGNVFIEEHKYPEALSHFKMSIAIQEKLKNKGDLAQLYVSIAEIYLAQDDTSRARECYSKALAGSREVDNHAVTMQSLAGLGFISFMQKNFRKALDLEFQAYELAEKMKFRRGLAEVAGKIGSIYEEKKDYPNAILYFSKQLAISKSIGYKENTGSACEHLASIYHKLKQFDKAYDHLVLFHGLKDSLLSNENLKQLAELNTRYETEKKENEIRLLTKDKQLNAGIIRQQQLLRWVLMAGIVLLFIAMFSIFKRYRFKKKENRILKEQLNEKFAQLELKTLQTQINPHFTFNCLNNISYFITSNQNKEASIYLNKFSKLLRLYIEHSRTLFVELKEEVILLTLYCELENLRFRKQFDFKLQIDASVKKMKIFVPSMILQLFVENAINHGLRYIERKGHLFIGFQLGDGILQIIITDDGIGRKASDEINRKKTKGHISRGLTLTNERIKIINAIQHLNISVQTEDLFPEKEETGTKVVINFPL